MSRIDDDIRRLVVIDNWTQEHQFSCFVQPDKDFYYTHQGDFIYKYQCLRAMSKLLQPKSIIELGVLAGAGADALLSGVNYNATYHGYDMWGATSPYQDSDGNWRDWDRYQLCLDLFKHRGFTDYKLTKTDTRELSSLPSAELVVVDAAHDYRNCYWDLRLAITANPKWIYVDDFVNHDLRLAVRDFRKEHNLRVKSSHEIDHISGGCLLFMQQLRSGDEAKIKHVLQTSPKSNP